MPYLVGYYQAACVRLMTDLEKKKGALSIPQEQHKQQYLQVHAIGTSLPSPERFVQFARSAYQSAKAAEAAGERSKELAQACRHLLHEAEQTQVP